MLYSFLFASRNDEYEGNAIERLTATLYALIQLIAMRPSLVREVEIVLVDWNSEVPLRTNPAFDRLAHGRKLVRIVEVSPAVARRYEDRVELSEVHALNLAAACARGKMLLRLDQDTLTGKQAVDMLIHVRDHERWRLHQVWWVGRKETPPEDYDDVIANPNMYVHYNCNRLPYFGDTPENNRNGLGAVGVLGIPRELWMSSGGYDQSMSLRGHMEIELVNRLARERYVWNLHDDWGTDFYHIWHTYDSKRPWNKKFDIDDQRRVAAAGIVEGADIFSYDGEGWTVPEQMPIAKKPIPRG